MLVWTLTISCMLVGTLTISCMLVGTLTTSCMLVWTLDYFLHATMDSDCFLHAGMDTRLTAVVNGGCMQLLWLLVISSQFTCLIHFMHLSVEFCL